MFFLFYFYLIGNVCAPTEIPKYHKDINTLAYLIKSLQPKLSTKIAHEYAVLVYVYSKKDNHYLMLSIIFIESSFWSHAIYKNKDFGLGQINHKTWGNHFQVSKQELLNPEINIKIIHSILEQLQKKHQDKENWYSYYHSYKPELRSKYAHRVNKTLQKINEVLNGR